MIDILKIKIVGYCKQHIIWKLVDSQRHGVCTTAFEAMIIDIELYDTSLSDTWVL